MTRNDIPSHYRLLKCIVNDDDDDDDKINQPLSQVVLQIHRVQAGKIVIFGKVSFYDKISALVRQNDLPIEPYQICCNSRVSREEKWKR